MNPLAILLLIFVIIPLIELYLLISVGSEIGALNTIGFSLLTAFIGGYLVRMQGFSTALRIHESSSRGELPAVEMIEGAILLLCGIMLLLPGFVTDAIGFLLLIPPLRRGLIINRLRRSGVMRPPQGGGPGDPDAPIEGEYQRMEKSELPRQERHE
jgi:UPF0716 protein FxsA